MLIFKRKISVSDVIDFTVAMLSSRPFLAILNGFAISLSTTSTCVTDAFAFFILFGFMRCETSSFFIIPNCSNSVDAIFVCRQCDSAQRCLAEIELVMENIPRLWLAASASIVCSSVESIVANQPCLN